MGILFLIIFIVSTAVHLYASSKKNQKLRNITKPFILLSLLGFYVFSASEIRIQIVLALIFSWLGDVLLMPKGNKWFSAGGVAFMISHLFFVLGYNEDIVFSAIPVWCIVFFAAAFVIAVSIIFSKLKEHLPKALFYPMFFYLLVNGTMNCFAIFRLLSNPCPATIITCIGAVLFFISDTSLFFVRFKKNSRLKTHFIVMLTYSIGEILIICGLL